VKIGDGAREGWSREQLRAAGWAPILDEVVGELQRAGFRLRSDQAAQVWAPGWLVCVRTEKSIQMLWPAQYEALLSRLRAEVEKRGPGQLEAAFALGGPEAVRGVLAAWGIL
jgi:hypothetical protein